VSGLGSLATGIAVALGDGWAFEPGAWDGCGTLRHADGRALFLTTASHGMSKGRVRVEGTFPGAATREMDACFVTVGVTRPAAAVARDLERRLLPRYEELLPEARERVARDQAEELDRERVAAEVMRVLPGTERSRVQARARGIALRPPEAGWRQEVEVYTSGDGTAVSIELHGLDPVRAVAMLEALGRARTGADGGAGPVAAAGEATGHGPRAARGRGLLRAVPGFRRPARATAQGEAGACPGRPAGL
jgi:hypothetical protein